jgi:hypothetical protein
MAAELARNFRTLETALGTVGACMFPDADGDEFTISLTDVTPLTVNRVTYSLYGRLHTQPDGGVSRLYTSKPGRAVSYDTFEITRTDWMSIPGGSYGKSKGSYAATEKTIDAVTAAVLAIITTDGGAWFYDAREQDRANRRERITREIAEHEAKLTELRANLAAIG